MQATLLLPAAQKRLSATRKLRRFISAKILFCDFCDIDAVHKTQLATKKEGGGQYVAPLHINLQICLVSGSRCREFTGPYCNPLLRSIQPANAGLH